jgi:hypothetical protein
MYGDKSLKNTQLLLSYLCVCVKKMVAVRNLYLSFGLIAIINEQLKLLMDIDH